MGLNLVGPTIIHWGADAQKRRHLSAILNADEIWCQGFSEPNAGSDLASLRTRAVDRGDHYVVDGQKVWTSGAHFAHWIILLARTDPDAPKHQGISCLLVPMTTPGITVRPLVLMTGHHHFNEVFFTDVVVPKTSLLGPVNQGWKVAMTTLMYERHSAGGRSHTAQIARLMALARQLSIDGRPAWAHPWIRQRLVPLAVASEALKYTRLPGLTRPLRGGAPGPQGSVLKLTGSGARGGDPGVAGSIKKKKSAGGEEQDRAGNVLGHPDPSERDVLAPAREDLVRIVFGREPTHRHRGPDAARAHRVDADAVRRVIERHVLREEVHAPLGGVVGRELRVAHDPGHRRHVHDGAAAAGPHHLEEREARDEEHAGEIDVQEPLPVLDGHGGHRRVAHDDARVVDEHVDPAEPRHGRLDHARGGRRRRHVALDGDRPPAGGQDAPDRLLQFGLSPTGDHHRRALPREELGRGAADPRPATRDQRPLPRQSHRAQIYLITRPPGPPAGVVPHAPRLLPA